jgi:hypothetical protein
LATVTNNTDVYFAVSVTVRGTGTRVIHRAGAEQEQLYCSVEPDIHQVAAGTEETEFLDDYDGDESNRGDVSQTDFDRDSSVHQMAAGIEKAELVNGISGHESDCGDDGDDDDDEDDDDHNDFNQDSLPVKRCYVSLNRLSQKSAGLYAFFAAVVFLC